MRARHTEQNWQNYRTLINGKFASCTVNLDIHEMFSTKKYNSIVQVSLPYKPDDEHDMPTLEEHHRVISELFRILIHISALPDILYAGHILAGGQLQMYFYCEDPTALLEVLDQFRDRADEISVQEDPHWDTYFDFLLPSPLEMKLNVTEEILDTLMQNGKDLEDSHLIEHTFQFADEKMMYQFMEEANISDISFNTMSYSHSPIVLPGAESNESVYIVKIEQEITLDTDEIFSYVEFFERLAEQFSGEYMGWQSDTMNRSKAN